MEDRTVQLVLHYDGAAFHGWQRQPQARTVQAELEAALGRLCGTHVPVTGSGRTDAGVHARGQAAGVRVPPRWSAAQLRNALNGVLPGDVWVAAAYEMRPEFHARYGATARRYRYFVGTDGGAMSPFRRRWEFAARGRIDFALAGRAAALLLGTHRFRGFAVQGTAPATDDHSCTVRQAEWQERPGGLVFEITANRFLHHMVRFIVGTCLDVASGRRPLDDIAGLLVASDNRQVSAPAPAHALFLEAVEYPAELYLDPIS
jgi:tRNA pseudouridine38-40 synthase